MTNLLGAHVSASGGVFEAVGRIKALGGTAFALFLKNERRWTAKPYDQDVIDKFHDQCKQMGYDARKSVLPHGSYLVNLASPDDEKRTKAFDAFVDDLQRCEQLGIGLYNFHPGSSLGSPKPEAISRIASEINKAHEKTKFVKVVLENMTGNKDRVVGTALEDLRDIIKQVQDKERVGVCIDTCHSFAAGYDMRTRESFDKFWAHFDDVIGYKYLAGIHLNDSKHPLDAGRDLHQNIGVGFLGLEAFRLIMNKKELDEVPKVLETPHDPKNDSRKEEIELLFSLIDKSEEDIKDQAIELAARGQKERDEVMKGYKDAKPKKATKQATKQTTLKRFAEPKKGSSKKAKPEPKDDAEETTKDDVKEE